MQGGECDIDCTSSSALRSKQAFMNISADLDGLLLRYSSDIVQFIMDSIHRERTHAAVVKRSTFNAFIALIKRLDRLNRHLMQAQNLLNDSLSVLKELCDKYLVANFDKSHRANLSVVTEAMLSQKISRLVQRFELSHAGVGVYALWLNNDLWQLRETLRKTVTVLGSATPRLVATKIAKDALELCRSGSGLSAARRKRLNTIFDDWTNELVLSRACDRLLVMSNADWLSLSSNEITATVLRALHMVKDVIQLSKAFVSLRETLTIRVAALRELSVEFSEMSQISKKFVR